jgi:hypothetical protein
MPFYADKLGLQYPFFFFFFFFFFILIQFKREKIDRLLILIKGKSITYYSEPRLEHVTGDLLLRFEGFVCLEIMGKAFNGSGGGDNGYYQTRPTQYL